MPVTSSSWTVVEPKLPALTFTYSFGSGIANALAFAVPDGLVVVSPPAKPADRVFTELESRGPIRALVAPNAFHHMGLAAWKKRYPDAHVFAPAQSIARIQKQSRHTGIRPLADAAGLLGDRVELIDMPHYKTGEVLVRWSIDGGSAWYLTDVMMNITKPIKGLFGMVFRWTRSTPGFRRNAINTTFMVKDRRALYAWLMDEAQKRPPKLIVMCHGDHLTPADPVGAVRAALA